MTSTKRHRSRAQQSKLTIRNIGAVALFLFGTTYLWLSTAFASPGIDTSGTWWSLTQVLSLVTLAGYTVATWGLFRRASWWARVTLAATALGVLVLVPSWIAADVSGETSPWFTVLVHLLGCAGVLVLLLAPTPRAWVERHVRAGH
jgi:peptidoglycan/LPS O-acetylase OafA/YrhL